MKLKTSKLNGKNLFGINSSLIPRNNHFRGKICVFPEEEASTCAILQWKLFMKFQRFKSFLFRKRHPGRNARKMSISQFRRREEWLIIFYENLTIRSLP